MVIVKCSNDCAGIRIRVKLLEVWKQDVLDFIEVCASVCSRTEKSRHWVTKVD